MAFLSGCADILCDVGLLTEFVPATMSNFRPGFNRVITYRLNLFGEFYALFQELLRIGFRLRFRINSQDWLGSGAS